ncbi:hypothetical protein CkaCkLH20_09161 [Colletotrichum karsti]|uniref:Uncharacterized protein n=1 Tax=Colletotrichum karsti TaxID=1095194 RepID=A0A9P6HYS7_9PEZI|nr:uncharacterized protein CkaCkLH20_09161 [Colletotrichum karsti]KAF9873348.1 hypothetical protein CkaCkLH20_09161 [Colletotrichum karsti]
MVDKRAYPASSQRDSSEEASKRQKIVNNPLKNIRAIVERAPRDLGHTSESPVPQTPATIESDIPIAERAINKFSKRPAGENTLNFHKAPPKMAPLRPVPNFALPTQQQAFNDFISQNIQSAPVSTDEMDLLKHLEASDFDDSAEGIIKRMNSTGFRITAPMAPTPDITFDGLPSDGGARKTYNPNKGLVEQLLGMKEWEWHDRLKGHSSDSITPRNVPASGNNQSATTNHNIANRPENEDEQLELVETLTPISSPSSSSASETSDTQSPIANEHTDTTLPSLPAAMTSLNNFIASVNVPSGLNRRAIPAWAPDYPTNFPQTNYIIIPRSHLEDVITNLTIARMFSQAMLARTQRARETHDTCRASLAALRDSLPALGELSSTVAEVESEAYSIDKWIDHVAKALQSLGNGAASYY